MNIFKDKIGIDWSQTSTKRSAVRFIGYTAALIYLFVKSDPMGFSTIIGGVEMAASGIGVIVKD
jgi:hypothetical protein